MAKDNQILPENTKVQIGRSAQRNNILAAKLVAETVRTTLGPKGMDKLLVDQMGEVVVTNDGATILREMAIEHPTAKMIIEIAKTQEAEIGDGTTSAVILAGELLKQAEYLLDKNIHPTLIVNGYRLASQKALALLEQHAHKVSIADTQMLEHIAITAMTGKSAELASSVLSKLCVQAIKDTASIRKQDNKTIMTIDLDHIRRQPVVGQAPEDSSLVHGLIIDKERVHPDMPARIQNAKIALLNVPLELRDTEMDAKITISSPEQMQQFLDQEERMLRVLVDKVIKSGANVVITQKGVDEIAQAYLAKAGIYVIRRVKKSDAAAVGMATGAKIVSNLNDLTHDMLGSANMVEERKFGEAYMTVVSGCPSGAIVTMLVNGDTTHVVAEIMRSIDDALGDLASALKSGKALAGAGAPEIMLSRGLREYARSLGGKEQMAVLAFAQSMEIIPTTLAENAGLDPIDAVAAMNAAHESGKHSAGINVFDGGVVDAWEKGIIEPLSLKTHAIHSATQVAIMILRIDDIIAAVPMTERRGTNPDE